MAAREPLAARRAGERLRQAVLRGWCQEFGPLTVEQLDAPITDEQGAVVRALARTASLEWRDEALGPILELSGSDESLEWPLGRSGLWTVAEPLSAARVQGSFSLEQQRPSVCEVLSSASNIFGPVFNYIGEAHAAIDTELTDVDDRIAHAIRRLCSRAWHFEVVVQNRRGWDDAPWWDYLELPELMPWLAVGLGLPGEYPENYGYVLVADAAHRLPSSLGNAWTWHVLPEEFFSEMITAVKQLVTQGGDR
ncbi:hypothetical protein OHB26_25190 [Nocardia sp. NBC_01503]|uniref:hypothetical protein n=1 Tax=Nocardia sp. NBC_01503 TaxID=2975997 RepID=UPI002E7B91B8|nr:hypothetical protein [Nocardia sp. NBC_01503]WTL30229.1 hypothetical protein OHB26_25190 [Nocardia sp. NBC_01503]